MRLLGDLITVAKDVPAGFRSIRRERGRRARMRLGLTDAVLFSDPEDVKSILTAKEPSVTKSKYSAMFRNLFGNSIISASGDEWERQHAYLIEHFHARNIPRWTSIIMPITEAWLERLGDCNQPFGAEAEARILIQDIVGDLLFGDLLSNEERREALGDLQTLNDEIFGQFITNTVLLGPFQLIPTPGRTKVATAKRRFTRMIFELLDKEIPPNHPSITAKLLAVEPSLPKEEIRDQLSILYFAGQDTTARSVAWTLLLLAKHPHHQTIIANEWQEAVSISNEPSIKALQHTHAVVQESLRLFPPGHTMDRCVNDDTVIEGFHPRNPILTPISVTNLHSDAEHWDNPDSFDPSRFNSENRKGRHTCAYMPFGHGKRTCIGKALALLELTLITAMTCARFKIECLNASAVKPKAAVSLGPDPDIQLRLLSADAV